ncbi:hypothetical protein HK102_001283 [Quaeritorhiza haematococci]|nr:hypothetical protein HK102_001283 [Quaeritorhiza haematococci]
MATPLSPDMVFAYVGLVSLLLERERTAIEALLLLDESNDTTVAEESKTGGFWGVFGGGRGGGTGGNSTEEDDGDGMGANAPSFTVVGLEPDAKDSKGSNGHYAARVTHPPPRPPAQRKGGNKRKSFGLFSMKSSLRLKQGLGGQRHPLLASYVKFSEDTMKALAKYNGLSDKESKMISELIEHGVTLESLLLSLKSTITYQRSEQRQFSSNENINPQPNSALSSEDASPTLADKKGEDTIEEGTGNEDDLLGVAYTMLSNLIFASLEHSVAHGGKLRYDARLRSVLRHLAGAVYDATVSQFVCEGKEFARGPNGEGGKSSAVEGGQETSRNGETDAVVDEDSPGISSEKTRDSLVVSAMVLYEDLRARAKSRSILLQEVESLAAQQLWDQSVGHQQEQQHKQNMLAGQNTEGADTVKTAEEEQEAAAQQRKRWIAIGLASVGGGVVVGLTGGLAAPLIGVGLGSLFTGMGITGGTAALAGVLCTTTGAAMLGTLFGAAGGGVTAYRLNRRMKDLDEFGFHSIVTQEHSLHVVIAVSGWLSTSDDVWQPWMCLPAFVPFAECDALYFDRHHLLELGDALQSFVSSTAVSVAATEILKQTVLASLVSALVWPVGLLQLSYVVDNPFSVGLDRAEKAGKVLAREVIARGVHGARPVTLVGWSLGARVIFYACRELAAIGCYGVVDSVYLAGAPVESDPKSWRDLRSVCSGRVVNGYCSKDWLLGFLFRATSATWGIAGLGPVSLDESEAGDKSAMSGKTDAADQVEASDLGYESVNNKTKFTDEQCPSMSIENVDLTDIVNGHLRYRDALPDILEWFGFEREASLKMPARETKVELWESDI